MVLQYCFIHILSSIYYTSELWEQIDEQHSCLKKQDRKHPILTLTFVSFHQIIILTLEERFPSEQDFLLDVQVHFPILQVTTTVDAGTFAPHVNSFPAVTQANLFLDCEMQRIKWEHLKPTGSFKLQTVLEKIEDASDLLFYRLLGVLFANYLMSLL